MKKLLLIAFGIALLSSCKETTPPKEIATEFIQAVHAGDAAKAAHYVTENTAANVSTVKAPVHGNATAEENFSLSTLTETVSGDAAEVKNEFVKLSLQKENGDWRVAATPELLASLSQRQEGLSALQNKWEALLKEYEGRLRVANDYVQYKKHQGALPASLQNVASLLNTLNTKPTWNKETVLQYVQRQKQLEEALDKALEPSHTAHADMSMNYFLQLHQATERIEKAQADYAELAAKTPSAICPLVAAK